MDPVLENLGLFASGFLRSLGIAAWGLLGSLVWGTVLAVFRISPVPVLRAFGTFYVTWLRNTPLAIVLFTMAFGIPAVGINASYYVFGVVGLVLYTSAFVCEAVRSGVATVPTGQAEAARSIGLTFSQTLGLIVLPQALRAVVPPVGNVLIAMIKNSAVVGALGVGGDLFSVYNRLTSAQGYAALPVLTGVAIGFLVMTLTASALLALFERRAAVAR
ncbi:amino acid ABC transporter permease [Paenibacillus sp. TRM 82003]|uniref:amino acid ABC transporter permease n=1 Tax=Kineococcus sp. TRM81007 TaxID=2925831 RepID=UPI001F59B465|nr:amino acid ABC transporter permease [Kineococcus sp. TRM81007]MCI2240319.1 amino acid ABC transporter permease [Kineococcus sp. TRM81007]MCI3927504.1 amino acid ABC transporter permease [Paenibacillus sp. TRM 82003]